ncbi:hypothetical protein R1flu_012724 [Riccia fluitans]|uniref:Uncharacterized protein n=1 Tax=Riccia fluitans TaxID=41844 RepID=A0ABD1ZFI9_9MARC
MDEYAESPTRTTSPPMNESPKKNLSPSRTDNSTPKEADPYEEDRARASWRWQHALSQSLAAVAECIRAIPPGLDGMDASLTNSLQVVAEECKNAIPGRSQNPEQSGSQYSGSDMVEMRLNELESKFHLLIAYAKANAHAIARAYNRSCLRLSDLMCPLLDKNESVPPDFPDTIGHFQQLSQEAVLNLLETYQVPEIPDTDDERRIDLARYIGVNI